MRSEWSAKARKTALGASVALGSLGLGGVGFTLLNGASASAATTPSGSTPSASTPSATHPGRRYLLRHAVDATVTVKTKNGYETVKLARGTVGAISSTSITVNSADGTSLTATINAQTKFHNTTEAQLATGDKVGVVAYDGIARLVNAPKTTSPSASS